MSPRLYDKDGNLIPPGERPEVAYDRFGNLLTAEDIERRSRPVSYGYYEDEHELLRRTFVDLRRRDRNWTAVLFAVLAIVATFAAWRSYDAGRDSQSGLERASLDLRRNAYDSALASCVGGSELRVLIARGFDALRRTAVADARGRAPPGTIERFFAVTQPPIDDFLTQAAYERDSRRRYHVRAKLGKVTRSVENEVLALAERRCLRRADRQFREQTRTAATP